MTITFDEFVQERKLGNNDLIQGIYKNFFGIEFDVNVLWDTGTPITENEIKAGDILYFDLDETEKQIAVATLNSKFVYLTGRGIRESSFDNENYWINHFIGARRVVN